MTRTVDITPFRPTPLAGPMTYEEFLEWDGENQHVEWVNGEVIPMPPVSNEHTVVTFFLTKLLGQFAELTNSGEVKIEPFQIRPAPGLHGRAPDLMFIRTENLRRLKRMYLDGPADLIIEVISPGTRGIDRGEKFAEYEQGGVPEYWILDPERQASDFYQFGSQGLYELVRHDPDGVYRSQSIPNLWVRPAWFWQDPRPTVQSILKEWGLV